ncbi:hypothetical protein QE152_g4157 [Popillia japonica]|uniref:Reverse transcriptase RNase H-like domain-containing protein n=1 Tax=Popillia japonica TaxID=7064 RepID=A0AAW1N1G5_POPJA
MTVSDHYSLLWPSKLQNPSGRLARWAVRIQQYDFTIVHRKGEEHAVPDALSRAVPLLDSIGVSVVWRKNFVLFDAAKYYTAKLADKFVEPFMIHGKVGRNSYELEPFMIHGKVGRNSYELKRMDEKVLPGTWHSSHLKCQPDD